MHSGFAEPTAPDTTMDLKFSEKIIHKCRPFPFEIKPSRNLLCYNPVEEHLIALRQCAVDVNELKTRAEKELKMLHKGRRAKEELKSSKKELNVIITKKGLKNSRKKKGPSIAVSKKRCLAILPRCFIPMRPKNYPFRGVVSTRLNEKIDTKVKFIGLLHERIIAKLVEKFVRNVIIETGFSSPNMKNNVVNVLIDATDKYLKFFILLLARNRLSENSESDEESLNESIENSGTEAITEPKTKSDDLYGPLEKTIREIGVVGGIRELHRFYYEKIVKKHDRLLKECKYNIERYNELRVRCLKYFYS